MEIRFHNITFSVLGKTKFIQNLNQASANQSMKGWGRCSTTLSIHSFKQTSKSIFTDWSVLPRKPLIMLTQIKYTCIDAKLKH